MQLEDLIVVGAGHATAEFVSAVRQEGFHGRVLVIGSEPHLPYQRPPLSKGYLAGTAARETLFLKARAAYEKAQVEFRLGSPVVRIDRLRKCVWLADGDVLSYGRLVLNLGGRARRLSLPGTQRDSQFANLHYVRTIDDIDVLREQCVPGARLVIVGGGFIGLESAAVAVQLGLKVTVLEAAPRLLARVTAPVVSSFYESMHRRAGVEVRTDVGIAGVEVSSDGTVITALRLADGTTVEADVVIAGVGLTPNTEIAEAAGLLVDAGIVVDEFSRTSDHDIVAAGDCTRHFSTLYGRRVRVESVPNAMEQARTAAATICGRQRPHSAVPWFWSDQYDVKLQIAGLSDGYDELVLRGATADASFAAFYLREGRLIAADTVRRPQEFMIARQLIARQTSVDARRLADESIPVKALLNH